MKLIKRLSYFFLYFPAPENNVFITFLPPKQTNSDGKEELRESKIITSDLKKFHSELTVLFLQPIIDTLK